jgi:starch phosphorylase
MDIYFGLKDGSIRDFTPTAFIFGAKSAPGYRRAKAIIRYINRIAKRINNDPDVADKLRVVFVQNYNCSYAEHIIPAADISEQISPAGTEASGTGNMKLMLNGAVTLGTYDGANIEIFEQAEKAADPEDQQVLAEGQDRRAVQNNFVFGAKVEELNAIKAEYDPNAIYEADPRLRRVIDALGDGTFEPEDAPMQEGELVELRNSLLKGASWHQPDHYFILKDYASYMDAKLDALRATKDQTAFAKMCLNNIAGAGKFSSDRTIAEYWNELWG